MKRFLILLQVLIAGGVQAAEPLNIETYGDSLTAGFLAHTSLTSPPDISELSQLMQGLAFGFLQKNRELIKKFEAHEKSWPYWVAEYLKQGGTEVGEVINLAVSGSRSSGILEQVKSRGRFSNSAWGLFFVGHNDLCHVKEGVAALVQEFSQNLSTALSEWDKNHRNSIAFLLPTSPVYQLYPVLENHIWFESSKKEFTCKDAWTKYFPYCPSFYYRYKKGELESYLRTRGAALNKSLEQMAESETQASKNGNKFYVLDAQWPLPLQPEYFAVDCYHIAEAGQKIFAANIIRAISKTLTP